MPCWARNIDVARPTRLPPMTSTGTSTPAAGSVVDIRGPLDANDELLLAIVTDADGPVFQKMDVAEQIRGMRGEFPLDQTHGIALWPKHRLIADSRGLGWHDAYTPLASGAPWGRTLPPAPHYCIAYCPNRAAHVTRVIDGEARTDSPELRPRHFGVVPADRA